MDNLEMTASVKRFSRLFGLIIGIDTYGLNDLRLMGAVHDADIIHDFLVHDLHANPQHIINLRNAEATRDNILDAIISLSKDHRIQKNDPIVIYFAGRGSRCDVPSLHSQEDVICPTDMTPYSEGIPEEQLVPGIPSQTIAILLNHLSRLKGNNITVILDCCYIAGPVRSSSSVSSLRPRMFPDPPPFSPSYDANIFQNLREGLPEEPYSPGSMKEQNQGSYVLLTACSLGEVALETSSKDQQSSYGLFTNALVRSLRGNNRLTYRSLIASIKLSRQTPRCFGLHVNRMLFDVKQPESETILSLAHTHEEKDGTKFIILEAGTIHGIRAGGRVALYKNHVLHSLRVSVGILEVSLNVGKFIAQLQFPEGNPVQELPKHFFAQQLESEVYVMSNDLPRLKNSVEAAAPFNLSYLTPPSIPPRDSNDPFIQVMYEDLEHSDRVYFERPEFDPATPSLGRRFKFNLPATDSHGILDFINYATRFYRHLRTADPHSQHFTSREPSEQGQTSGQTLGVEVEFYKLHEEMLEWDTRPQGPNKVVNDTIKVDLRTEVGTQWGMKIRNNTTINLYLHLFVFHASDLTIEPWYLPPSGRNSACSSCHEELHEEQNNYCINPHSEITIGYGDSGAPPLIIDSDDVDVKYLKVYLTSEAVDLGNIAQKLSHDFIQVMSLLEIVGGGDNGSHKSESLREPVTEQSNDGYKNNSNSSRIIPVPEYQVWFSRTISLFLDYEGSNIND